MRRAVAAVIFLALLASAMSLSAHAQSQSIFYLHDGFVLDESAPTAAGYHYLQLDAIQPYVWKSVAFSTGQTFLAGTWTATVWISIIEAPTQYKVELGVVDQSGAFISSSSSFTPLIQSVAPTQFSVAISAETLNVGSGESLAVAFLRQWQDGSNSPTAFLFFDSMDTPSGLISPGLTTTAQQTSATTTQTTTAQETTTTTTQPLTTSTTTQPLTTSTIQTATEATTQVGTAPGAGFAFAFVAVGAGVASAGAGLAVAATGQPQSEVFTYGGYYYCRKHRVPLYSGNGWSWCPVERRYLTKLCQSCGSSIRQNDRFCDRCGRAVR